jgi:ABC-type transport system involved in cytochrome c biogenesis permease component
VPVNTDTWQLTTTVRIILMNSVKAVGIGVLLSLAVGLLVVQGILAPLFTRFLGLERTGPEALPLILLLFASAFSFYFGGMAASYKAPSRHILHGVMVVPVAFLLASGVNLALGKGLLPGIQGTGALLLAAAFLLASTAASYVGSKRGAEIYAHNQRIEHLKRK